MSGILHEIILDACAIIYLIESEQQQGQATRLLIKEAIQKKAQLIVSRLSFLECRVLPLKENNTDLLVQYNQFFQLPSIRIIELSADVVNLATDLRASYSQSLRTPDALQVACAISVNVDQFITGDKKLSIIDELKIIIV